MGAYIEDHEYVAGSGHLDAFNGRFAVTPEYPEGTYAYYATVDEDHNGQYPYFFPAYRGVVETDNFGGGPGPGGGGGTNVTIDEPVETWSGGDVSGVSSLVSGHAGFYAYPNPVRNEVRFAGQLPGTVAVFDALGRCMAQWSSHTLVEGVNLSGWPAGTYCCKDVETGQHTLLILHP